MNANMLFSLLALVMMLACTEAKRMCKVDADCKELGGLKCIKSGCDIGICSCDIGYVAKYLGSKRHFQCVRTKKVGESCSTDGDDGVCAAEGSYCDQYKTRKCKCEDDLVPMWGGELCAHPQRAWVGETCSPSVGICSDGSQCHTIDEANRWHQQVQLAKPTCACDNRYTIKLDSRTGHASPYNIAYFPHKIQPLCLQKLIGDICIYDADCPDKADCVNGRCACESGVVPDLGGSVCKKPVEYGQKCKTSIDQSQYHCDGSKGLMCYNVCYIDVEDDDTDEQVCTCAPYYVDTGSGCTERKLGDQCYGDYNCKGISLTAVCVNGACEMSGGSQQLSGSVSFMLLPLATFLLHMRS